MPRTITTTVEIDASPARVWEVLVDFDSHPEWDPFLATISGRPELGSRLEVRFRQGMRMRPQVTEAAVGRVLEWQGKLGPGGLFDGRHRFQLEPIAGGTRLIHSESFTGILVPFLGGMLDKTEAEFARFNQALKRRVEEGEAAA